MYRRELPANEGNPQPLNLELIRQLFRGGPAPLGARDALRALLEGVVNIEGDGYTGSSNSLPPPHP